MDPVVDFLGFDPKERRGGEVGALKPAPAGRSAAEQSLLSAAATAGNTAFATGFAVASFPTPFGSWESVWLASAHRSFSLIGGDKTGLLVYATEFLPYLHYLLPGLDVAIEEMAKPGAVDLLLPVPPVDMARARPWASDQNYDFVVCGKVASLASEAQFLDTRLGQLRPGGWLLVELVGFRDHAAAMPEAFALSRRFARANFFIPFGADGRVFLVFRDKLEKEAVNQPDAAFQNAWEGYAVRLSRYCDRLSDVYIAGRQPDRLNFPRMLAELKIPEPATAQGPHQLQTTGFPETRHMVPVGYPFVSSLPEWFPQLPYSFRGERNKTVLHWGQRKLFIAELEFLLRVVRPGEKGVVMVYAGAASGEHLGALMHLADVTGREIEDWVLFDKNLFRIDKHLYGRIHQSQLHIRSEFYTDTTSDQLRAQFPGRRFLFISDIRSGGLDRREKRILRGRGAGASLQEQEMLQKRRSSADAAIAEDMRHQMLWYQQLVKGRPDGAGLFKFRITWDDHVVPYMRGTVLLPVWGPQSTTECRLLVEGDGTATTAYSDRRQEQQMFFFNNVYRPAQHPHLATSGEYDGCYDCRAEVQCLADLLLQTRLESKGQYRRRRQVFLSSLNAQDRKAATNLVWDVLEEINDEINLTAHSDRPRQLETWVQEFSPEGGHSGLYCENAELMGLLPRAVARLGVRLNSEIGSGRTLHTGDAAFAAKLPSAPR